MSQKIQQANTGSMFHTNYYKLERAYRCDDDCLQSGCPGHVMSLHINNTAGVAELKTDGEHVHWFGCNDAEALYEIFKQLKES